MVFPIYNQRDFRYLQNSFILLFPLDPGWVEENLDGKIDHFNSADDREASEETHGASNKADLILKFDLYVSLYFIKAGRVEKDLNQLQRWVIQLLSWK